MSGPATDYGRMQPQQKMAWGHKSYQEFVEQFFFTSALGKASKGEAAIIEHVTELSTNNKGESGAFFNLVPRLVGGGIVGDNEMVGRERSSEAHWQQINYDQIRNAIINKGEMADQKSVLQIRTTSRPLLSAWLADSWEDQAIMVASGVSFDYNTDGSARTVPEGQDSWSDLAYAADITAPSTNRHFRWDATLGLVAGDTAALVAADVPVYEMLPDIKAMAANKRIPPLIINGKMFWLWLVHEDTMARLYKDANFRSTLVNAEARGADHPIFTGALVTMNGLIIKPYTRVFNTRGAASGSKWGATGTDNGTRSLLLGSQALALADLGVPQWLEDERDYGNRNAVGIRKWGGWLKPQFPSSYDGGSVEDFGMACIDMAL